MLDHQSIRKKNKWKYIYLKVLVSDSMYDCFPYSIPNLYAMTVIGLAPKTIYNTM